MEPEIIFYPFGDNPPKASLYYGLNVLESLRLLPDKSVQTVCTSPPYWGLRDYGTAPVAWGGDEACDHEWGQVGPPHHPGQVEQSKWKGAEAAGKGQTAGSGQFCSKCDAWFGQLGLEPTPEQFISHLVEVFREVHRVLRDDGTLWVNLGDSYCGGGGFAPDAPSNTRRRELLEQGESKDSGFCLGQSQHVRGVVGGIRPQGDIKAKDLVGIPWMAAFALRADGWYLRSDLIWAKNNPMPESVTDRPTRAHEFVFLLTKKSKYFYDHEAIKEGIEAVQPPRRFGRKEYEEAQAEGGHKAARQVAVELGQGTDTSAGNHFGRIFGGHVKRNKRSVWTVNPKPYKGAHFAVWPPLLVEPMILAGTSEHGACADCGAPFERVVEKQEGAADQDLPQRTTAHYNTKERYGAGNTGPVTVGWNPTCKCGQTKPPVRCVVMDIFSGSATTGMVALKEGRDYIGLDLNPDYLALAKARLLDQTPPAKAQESLVQGDLLDLFGSEAIAD